MHRDRYIAALKHERESYLRTGRPAKAAGVAEELRRLGVEVDPPHPADDADAVAPGVAKRTSRRRKPAGKANRVDGAL